MVQIIPKTRSPFALPLFFDRTAAKAIMPPTMKKKKGRSHQAPLVGCVKDVVPIETG
jgi:hypothetical protein